jgi:hypothetical protein
VLSLDTEIEPEKTAVGDPIRAVLAEPLKNGDTALAPRGAAVDGRLLRLEKHTVPFNYYVIAFEFHTLESDGVRAEFAASMETAGPASGLIRQEKQLNPTFTRKRGPRMEILVKEFQRGQGVLYWDAKQSRIRRGLRMRWRIDPPERAAR